MATIWSVIEGRAELLETIERFVADAKADPRAWSRESPGDVCAFGSNGGGYSMEVALRIALTGDADDELDATIRISEETWDRLGAVKPPDEDGVEGIAHLVLGERTRQAVRLGSARLRDYFVAARPRSVKPSKGLLLMIGHSMYSQLAAIADGINEELGVRDGSEGSWEAESVASVFLDDAANGREFDTAPSAPKRQRAEAPTPRGLARVHRSQHG